jgi:hypothetical protein
MAASLINIFSSVKAPRANTAASFLRAPGLYSSTSHANVLEQSLQLSLQTMLDPNPWDRWEAVQCRSCVYFTGILILFVVKHPLKVDSHKSLTTFTSKRCWVGVVLVTTSVLATSGGCRPSAIIGFVSVTSTESYISGYYAQRRIRRYRVGNTQSGEVLQRKRPSRSAMHQPWEML